MNEICTSLEQSKKLLELGIDVNTADMYYQKVLPKSEKIEHNPKVGNPLEGLKWYNKGYTHFGKEPLKLEEYCTPAWSLSALLGLMPKLYEFENDPDDGGCQPNLCKGWDNNLWHIVYRSTIYITEWHDEPIDAAFEMVVWLKENEKI